MIEGVKNACTKMGEFGATACTKVSEMGGRAISWIIETSSTIASKLKEFAVTTLFPALKKLFEGIANCGRIAVDKVKQHPKEFAVVGIAGALFGVVLGGVIGLVTGKFAFGGKKNEEKTEIDINVNQDNNEIQEATA